MVTQTEKTVFWEMVKEMEAILHRYQDEDVNIVSGATVRALAGYLGYKATNKEQLDYIIKFVTRGIDSETKKAFKQTNKHV